MVTSSLRASGGGLAMCARRLDSTATLRSGSFSRYRVSVPCFQLTLLLGVCSLAAPCSEAQTLGLGPGQHEHVAFICPQGVTEKPSLWQTLNACACADRQGAGPPGNFH